MHASIKGDSELAWGLAGLVALSLLIAPAVRAQSPSDEGSVGRAAQALGGSPGPEPGDGGDAEAPPEPDADPAAEGEELGTAGSDDSLASAPAAASEDDAAAPTPASDAPSVDDDPGEGGSAEGDSAEGASTEGESGCGGAGPCGDPEHNSMLRLGLGGGGRHDEDLAGFFAGTVDISLRPLLGMLLIGLSASTQLAQETQIVSGGIQLELDLSHLIESRFFSCVPDRDRPWGLSIGTRLGLAYAVSHRVIFEDLEAVGFALLRPEWMLMAEVRFRLWPGAEAWRLLARVEHHMSLEATPSRTLALLGFTHEFTW